MVGDALNPLSANVELPGKLKLNIMSGGKIDLNNIVQENWLFLVVLINGFFTWRPRNEENEIEEEIEKLTKRVAYLFGT